MSKVCMVLLAGAALAGGARAGEASAVKRALTSADAAAVSNAVAWAGGIEAARGIEKAGYDAADCCERALASTNFWLIDSAVSDLPPAEQARYAVAFTRLSRNALMAHGLFLSHNIQAHLTPEDRDALAAVAYVSSQPECLYVDFWLPWQLRQGRMSVPSAVPADVDMDVLVASLLCGTSRVMLSDVENCKAAIKGKCVAAAKAGLRKAGKSFVTKTAVTTNAAGAVSTAVSNPLQDLVRPVVDALNAPECGGLEAAVRAFGFAVPDKDRSRLRTDVRRYADDIMYGVVPADPYHDGSVSVLLGVAGYNAWVREYNEGKE